VEHSVGQSWTASITTMIDITRNGMARNIMF
jgi:hypothetical protein